MSTTPSMSTSLPLRALVMREARPAVVEGVAANTEAFARLVGGEPMILPLTDDYAIIFGENGSKRPNVRVIDAGGPGFGMIPGTCFVVRHRDGALSSLDDGDVAALRGWLEARRIGVC